MRSGRIPYVGGVLKLGGASASGGVGQTYGESHRGGNGGVR